MAGRSNTNGVDDRLTVAIGELRRERRRNTDELEAFRTFEDQIRSIAVEETHTGGRPVGIVNALEATALDRVQNAYETTIMSVPHYIEEYGDSYVESLAGEFSPDLAAALTDGTEFNGRCKRTLLSAVSNAQSARESLLGTIDHERESLRTAKEDLEQLIEECSELETAEFSEMDFGTLDAYRARLDAMTQQCGKLSEQRQEAIFDQRRIQRIPADVPDVAIYFYQSLDVDYPVMSVIADLLDSITALQRQIEREIAYCRA